MCFVRHMERAFVISLGVINVEHRASSPAYEGGFIVMDIRGRNKVDGKD